MRKSNKENIELRLKKCYFKEKEIKETRKNMGVLRELRKKYGYTQEYIARCLSMSQTAYSNREREITELKKKDIELLSRLYNEPKEYFL